MPLSLWGLDEARKNFNERVDKTGSAAWNAARGKKPKDEEPRRSSTVAKSANTTPTIGRDSLPPQRKLSEAELAVPPPKAPAARQYADAKNKRPPPPPLPSRESSLSEQVSAPTLPQRSTSTAAPTNTSEDSALRPSELFNRAPTFPLTIRRNENQDGITNELAEKLAKMRTRNDPQEKTVSTEYTKTKPPALAKHVAQKPPAPVIAMKPVDTKPNSVPVLPPRTTPAPPRVPAPKPVPPPAPVPSLPYQVSQLHKNILPKFNYPTPDSSCNSFGLDTFNRLFPQPLWELEQASLFILATLYPSDSTYTFTPKRLEGPISLIMRNMDGNAFAENSTAIVSSGGRREYKWRSNLVFSTKNLTNIANWKRGDAWFIGETRGVIVHELTHSWQWSCNGIPSGLTEGTYY